MSAFSSLRRYSKVASLCMSAPKTIRPIRYNQAMRLLSICCCFLFAIHPAIAGNGKIKRISFDEVEGLEGEKLVLFVSKKDEKAKAQAKASIKVLRSVKNIHASSSNRDENIGGFSYVLVDCASRKSNAKCKAAGFSSFPRWFVHSVEGGIEELWHPFAQTSESILEFLAFRSSEELNNIAVPSLRSLSVIPHLAFQRPVVVQYNMPWSGRSQRFDKHYRKVYTLQQDQYFLYTVDCDKNSDLCTAEGIDDYPTIRVYFKSPSSPHFDENAIHSVDYEGNEVYDGLSDFLTKNDIKTYHKMGKIRKWSNSDQNRVMPVGVNVDAVASIFDEQLQSFEKRMKKWLAKGLKKMEKRITDKVSRRFKDVMKEDL